MLSLKALENALVKVEKVREHEITFEAGDTQITLRAPLPDEEKEILRYAEVAMENTGVMSDMTVMSDYLDRQRYSTLGHCIVKIGNLDLRNVDYIETDDFDDEGNKVILSKHDAVIQLMRAQWSRSMISQVFLKFAELAERIETRAEKAIKFDPSDLDEEIGRVSKRLEELKAARDKTQSPAQDLVQKSQQAAIKASELQAKVRHDGVVTKPVVPEEVSEPPPEPVAQRRPVVPVAAPPPVKKPVDDPLAKPLVFDDVNARGDDEGEEEVVVENPNRIPDPYEGDSFMDMGDPDAAIEAETRRQQVIFRQMQEQKEAQERARQQVKREPPPPATPPPGPVHDVSSFGGKDPGLRAALNIQNRGASEPPIAKLPTQVLDRRSQDQRASGPVIDQVGSTNRNPRFRPKV
jgi:hypothetical protein